MPSARQARHDRRAIAALFAVFALMVQALIPGAAMARPMDPASIICTGTGTTVFGRIDNLTDSDDFVFHPFPQRSAQAELRYVY